MIIIKAENLIKDYITKNLVNRVINGVSLEIEQGDFVSITGESGSGKSTLLYLLSGLEEPTQGKVFFENNDLSLFSDREMASLRRKDFGFVYQYYNLIPNLSVYDNIVLPLKIERKIKRKDKEYLEHLIEVASLQEVLQSKPDQISGGQQQRASLLRALFIRPKVIFADEPTGNLDSKSTQSVMDLIVKINKDYGTTVVMVTHSPKEAAMAKRIITLEDGKIKN